ncbi:betaine/proline/choline family ABC transporter ATP-binding protein [Starkeya sp. 3C]|uniref:Quaternary amine transport ATP-binding protein n=1 Tax=Ancylobacter moscoviensis TaxID=2597768 RepID=A0ABY3DQ62_9HYPH|nr:ABC transporter ATP-binding protein [Ancylobacter moscoviensis]TSJ61657.1 betaine/proline/choline family ABC transporter ATP-binding protein [Ancylobacter moscoviensis]
MIRLKNLTKIYGGITAVDNVSIEVGAGEVCVLLGPSGCGKTTTMKMINRLIEPSGGRIFIGGKDVTEVDPVQLRRSIGYVIQQIGLFPNKTVEDNICVVPDMLGQDRKTSRKRAAELLEMVNLEPAAYAKRYPKELSGGQQQRVGVIRALAADPPVLLMDEPFGAIDPINREVIQDEFMKLQAAMKKTVIFVSHDIDEAVKMASRIAIFRSGRLIQYDTPDNILAHPVDSFVADFVGHDRTLKRLRLITVRDAMATEPPRVTPDDDVDTAVALMKRHGHVSVVMVGPQGKVLGFVRLEALHGKRGRVGEHYEKLTSVVHVDDNLRNAVSQMFANDQSWLACVSTEGVYQGYITQRSITHLLGATYRDR